MKIGILGRGKLSYLAEEYFPNDTLEMYDDTTDIFPNIDKCEDENIFITIGVCNVREELFNKHINKNILSLIHEKAYVSKQAIIGRGSVIAPNASILSFAHLGLSTFIYANTTIDVKVYIGDFTRVAANAYIGNGSKIGNKCIIGAGATILPGITIGDNCYITAGSLVTRSFGNNETISGSPARSVVGNNELHKSRVE